MLLIEKYIKSKNLSIQAPIPDNCGLISYSLKSTANDVESYYFNYYSWEASKSHPGCYSFKYYSIAEKPLNFTSYLTKDVQYVGWSDFFDNVEKFKLFILSSYTATVSKTPLEAHNMLWRAFLKTQDYSLAAVYKNLPSCFYSSIDTQLSQEEQAKAREDFVFYLKDKYYALYNAWNYFFDVDVEQKFCEWFYNYIYGQT